MTLDGKIANNQRIAATIPTLKRLLEKGAKILIITSHLGRPDGQIVPSLSLRPVSSELEKLMGEEVTFVDDCVGVQVHQTCEKVAETGGIVLLENLRFHLEEEGCVKTKDGSKKSASEDEIKKFRKELSSLGDIYVNDAFGAVHRAHSSIVGIDLHPRVAGLLVKKELEYFGKVLNDRIDLAILGGAKVSDKIQLIKNLLPRVPKVGHWRRNEFHLSSHGRKYGDWG